MKLTVRVILLLAMGAMMLSASTLSLSTDGIFTWTGQTGADRVDFGPNHPLSLSFDGIDVGDPQSNVTLPASNVYLGRFVTQGVHNDETLDPGPDGLAFILRVYVPAGSSTTGTASATLTGTIRFGESNLRAEFDGVDFVLGGASFHMAPTGYDILPPIGTNSSALGFTPVFADITEAVATTPEPGVMSLVGFGLIGIGVWIKSRKR
jgi:hypothetical protein